MFDLFFAEKIYAFVMKHEKLRHKLLHFLWRTSLIVAAVPEIIVLVYGKLIKGLPADFLCIVAAVVLAVSCAIAAGQWHVLNTKQNDAV